MPKRSKTEAAKSKVETATALSALGGAVGGPLGAGIGAVGGLIIGDRNLVFPVDMVCIPAYQAYMIQGVPALSIYIRAGESLAPTGGNVRDVQEAMQSEGLADFPTGSRGEPTTSGIIRKQKVSMYQQKYTKAFKQVASKHKKKDGTWKKGGFQKAVKEAHAKARKKNK